MFLRLIAAGLLALAMLVPVPASACPTCAQGIRKQVYAEVFGPDFATNLAITAVPFLLFAGIAVAVHGVPGQRSRTRRRVPGDADDKRKVS